MLAVEFTDSISLGEAVVGAGTLALAGFTAWLGFQARSEARAVNRESRQVGEQVRLQRGQVETAMRPYVVPAPNADWGCHEGRAQYAHETWRNRLPVKNAGPERR
jgi:hypothetical protein